MGAHRPTMRAGVGLLGAMLTSVPAHAAGFYLQESSVSALGSGFAGSTSSIEDASTVFTNPAGMTELHGAQTNIGVHGLLPHADLKNTGSTFDFNGPGPGGVGPVSGGDGGNPYRATPIPNISAAVPLRDGQLWLGFALSAPFGLATDYGDDWFGRFDSTRTDLKVINLQPSVAWRATDWLSVGGGVDIQHAHAELESAVSNVVSQGTSRLEGSDISYGYNLGVQARPVAGTRIGAQYRSAIRHDLEGTISVRGLTAGNFAIDGTAALDLPDIASVGITQDIGSQWRVMGQATWYGWSNFESITARNSAGAIVSSVPQNYRDTVTYSFGAEYAPCAQWVLRLGYQFDPTPTTDRFRSTRTPDGDRHWFTTGASYHLNPATSFDFAAAYIDVGDETIHVRRNGGLAAVNADSEGRVGIISAAVNYAF